MISHVAHRDIQSKTILQKSGIPEEKYNLSADEANLLEIKQSPNIPSKKGKYLIGVTIQNFRPHLGIHGASPQGRIRTQEQYIDEITKAFLCVSENTPGIEFLFIPSTTWDEKTCKSVYKKIKSENCQAYFLGDPTAKDFIAACQLVDIMVSTNMHPTIIAATANKPSIALSYHYKLDDYMNSIGLGEFICRIDDFTPDGISKLIQSALARSSLVSQDLKERHETVKKLARNNFKMVQHMLSKP